SSSCAIPTPPSYSTSSRPADVRTSKRATPSPRSSPPSLDDVSATSSELPLASPDVPTVDSSIEAPVELSSPMSAPEPSLDVSAYAQWLVLPNAPLASSPASVSSIGGSQSQPSGLTAQAMTRNNEGRMRGRD